VPEQELDARAQIEQLERELAEIDLLLQQTTTEAERQEARRRQQADRLATLERSPNTEPGELDEARLQLVVLTKRTALMEGQIQVLEGKQKVLRRFREYVEAQSHPTDGVSVPAALSPAYETAPPSRALLAAQEEMRREIARQMHDGPAQSIANIALQAQVVHRLLQRDPAQAEAELRRLGEMVQHALDATKAFIFDVRPMVLDDLGLVATLRRSCLEKARRSGLSVRFESAGQDRRLGEELESGLFRILEDALEAFVGRRPAEVTISLDWTDDEVRGSVVSRPPDLDSRPSQWEPPSMDEGELPPALAGVMRDRQEYEATKAAERVRATALPDGVWNEISGRAAALGIEVALSDDGHHLEASVRTAQS
jgi:two-component system, NarL family, sensor histidine kinase DegS